MVLTGSITVDLAVSQMTMLPFIVVLVVSLVTAVIVVSGEVRQGNPDARLILGGSVLLVASAVGDVLAMLSVIHSSAMWSHWGILGFVGSLTLVLVRRGAGITAALGTTVREVTAKNQQLEEMSTRLRQAVGELGKVVLDMRTSIGQQAETVARQAQALREAQESAKEIHDKSQAASGSAQEVLGATAEVDQVSNAGEEAIERGIHGMTEILAAVERMAERVGVVQERAGQIDGVVDEVKELGDQSSMLAINAAIEAARSGEHGRGFAVVAREVRTLAEQSIRSTERIRTILADVDGGIREAVESSAVGKAKVSASVLEVRATGEGLRRLSALLRDNAAAARRIATVVEQQNGGVTALFDTVSRLSQAMQETEERLRETEAAIDVVQRVAREMEAHAPEARS